MKKRESLRFAQLVDWIEGRLSEAEVEALMAQLASADDSVQDEVAWLRLFRQLSDELILAAPPAIVRQRLAEQFAAYAQGRPMPGFFRRLVATLAFDGKAQLALSGIRSAALPGLEQQLVYTTDVADIVLNVQPRTQDEQLDLVGQVFPLDEATLTVYSVQLLREAVALTMTTADDLGEFAFRALAPAVYEIVLSSDQVEIVVAPVDLRS